MNFKTKFNIKQHAWIMKDNKPIKVVISSITIFHVNTNQDCIKYNARNVLDSVSWLDHQDLLESSVFETEYNLLKSLFKSPIACKGEKCKAIMGVGHSKECINKHDKDSAILIPGFDDTLHSLNKLSCIKAD